MNAVSKIGYSLATEIQIRTSLVEYLLMKFRETNFSIASEMRYGLDERRADLATFTSSSFAFEIKSDFDSLVRLREQVEDYNGTFDYCYLVTTPNHASKARKVIPARVGIILFRDGEVVEVRKPKKNLRLSKYHLAQSCSREAFEHYSTHFRKLRTIQEVRAEAISKLNLSELRELFVSASRKKFGASTEHFLEHVDGKVHAEDLLILRRNVRIFA